MADVTNGRRVLWVTDEPPDRSLGGGNIRQAYLFEALARAYSTDLLVAGRVTDERVRAAAARVIELDVPGVRFTEGTIGRRPLALGVTFCSRYPLRLYAGRPARRTLARRLASAQADYDLVCVEHEGLAPLNGRGSDAPWVITFHHVLSGMIEKEIELVHNRRQLWFRTRDLRKALRLEERAVGAFHRCLVCCEEDAARLRAAGTQSPDKVGVVPNGVDLETFVPRPLPPEPRVLLPGTLAWGPNVDAARWLASDIWPRIHAAIPEATLVLAGRAPVPEVRELDGRDGIEVHADVPSMVPYFERARLVLVPLRIGTGTRLKALEAMAAARPVVGTSVGLDGIGVVDGVNAVIADTGQAIADAVIAILRDAERAESLARAGREHVERHFGWDRIGAAFVAQLTDVIESDGAQDARRSSSSAA